MPTIYGSVKNLIACALGKSYEAPLEPKIQPQNAMTCAKYLLQAIRSHPLPDVEEFCAQHPQPEDQLGVDRLEDICKYKVIYELRYKAEEKGGKITRLFGRSYIHWTKMWSVFRKSTVELIKQNTHIPMDEIEFFLQTYEESLALDGEFFFLFSLLDNCNLQFSLLCSETRERSATQSLIWTTDFNAVLSGMQKERHQRVDERGRATTQELCSLEAQLFQPTPRSGGHSSSSPPHSKPNSPGCEPSFRSRATTMEQLGLEPPQGYDAMTQLENMHSLRAQSQDLQDRERSTTLDLFAIEQQALQQQAMQQQNPFGTLGSPTFYPKL